MKYIASILMETINDGPILRVIVRKDLKSLNEEFSQLQDAINKHDGSCSVTTVNLTIIGDEGEVLDSGVVAVSRKYTITDNCL